MINEENYKGISIFIAIVATLLLISVLVGQNYRISALHDLLCDINNSRRGDIVDLNDRLDALGIKLGYEWQNTEQLRLAGWEKKGKTLTIEDKDDGDSVVGATCLTPSCQARLKCFPFELLPNGQCDDPAYENAKLDKASGTDGN